jgi:hypothetical protein
MTGLEIVGLVAGIVSAFTQVHDSVTKIILRRKQKKLKIAAEAERAESRLTSTLAVAPNRIIAEQHHGSARFGSFIPDGKNILTQFDLNLCADEND